MNPARQGRTRPLCVCASLFFSGAMLLGCSHLDQTAELIPDEVAVTPEVAMAPEELSLVSSDFETDIRLIPQPRIKPPMPRNIKPKFATATVRRLPPKEPALPAQAAPAESLIVQEAAASPVLPGELVGSDFSTVRDALREPDYVQSNALTIVWTYADPGCTLRLFFYPDIQTTRFHLLKYDLRSDMGDKLSDGSACMQHLGR
jgi:hypothetical protein